LKPKRTGTCNWHGRRKLTIMQNTLVSDLKVPSLVILTVEVLACHCFPCNAPVLHVMEWTIGANFQRHLPTNNAQKWWTVNLLLATLIAPNITASKCQYSQDKAHWNKSFTFLPDEPHDLAFIQDANGWISLRRPKLCKTQGSQVQG
jgi:hypothetical protein